MISKIKDEQKEQRFLSQLWRNGNERFYEMKSDSENHLAFP
jgi:hypothetical protein